MTTSRYDYAPEPLYPWRAFFTALVLYALLSVREVSDWTTPVWLTVAFGVIPALGALVLGRGRGGTVGDRIKASALSVGMAMALYTGFHLIRLHRGIGSASDAGTAVNVFFVGLTVSLIYAVGASVVSAVVGRLWSVVGARRAEENL